MSEAKWIWSGLAPQPEEYLLFRQKFTSRGENCVLRVAAETDYIARVNGVRVGFCAFAGYRDEKYFDTLDVTDACRAGENLLEITVRYEGVNSATHIDDGAGLWFELTEDGTLCAASGEDTQWTADPAYVQNAPRRVTPQLGFTCCMIAAPAPADSAFAPAVPTGRVCRLLPRPVVRMTEEAFCAGIPVAVPGHRIYDLGRETAGYLRLSVVCSAPCTVKIAYGEHLADGFVRQKIGPRDFSFDFTCAAGENDFEQLFVRAAARYLEVLSDAEAEVTVREIGLIPTVVPLTEKKHPFTGLDALIYETCVRTLRLCMHTHYEDCPWREQALYVLDSRNQMLCGYDAFEETDFQRANIVFISKGKRPDDMLELTYPAVFTPAIPFFSVMYPIEVLEYLEHTGDKTILPEVMDTVLGIMNALKAYLGDNGLLHNPPPPYWNFYEWSPGSDGHGELGNAADRAPKCDLILNCAYCLAADAVRKLCAAAEIPAPELPDAVIRAAIPEVLMNPATGIFASSTIHPVRSRLGNAFALLIGLGDERTAEAVAFSEGLIPETLSMTGFVYDALLAHFPDGKERVLADIREKYGYMLSCGATSFWETIKGEADFGRAGSLCHGWSAIPIVYLRRLLEQ